MKNDSNPIIRSQEVTIDMHICAALSESRGSGEIYFAAIAPDMELTVITLDEAPDILPCFDEDDAYLNIPDSSLLLSYNPAQVLKLAGKHLCQPEKKENSGKPRKRGLLQCIRACRTMRLSRSVSRN